MFLMVAWTYGPTPWKKRANMKNTTPSIVNFPRLHEELTTGPMPENIIFLASVLSEEQKNHGGQKSHDEQKKRGEQANAPSTLFVDNLHAKFPVPLHKAKQNARLLQEYGADLWESKQLSTLAVMSQNQASDERKQASELEEIKKFIASQGKDSKSTNETPSSQSALHTALTGKELALCIAYDLEQAIIDTRLAIDKLGKANADFLSSLHDNDDSGDVYETIATLETFTKGTDINLSYQSVLESILPFIPQDALLFTNDADVLESLDEAGLFDSLPSAPFLEPEPFTGLNRFQQISLPAWKILGLQEANPLFPWTSRTLTLCYPARPAPLLRNS